MSLDTLVSATSGAPEKKPRNSFLVFLISIAVVLVVSDLLGWWLHVSWLTGFFPEAATMKANTALCLLCLALAVLLKQWRGTPGRVADLLASLAVAIAATTLLEYWTGRTFGIDQLLADAPMEMSGDPAGRMSEGSAIDVLISGIAILCLDRIPMAGTLLAGCGSLLTLSALVGFIFDAGPLLGVPLLRSMAIRTVVAFATVQIAYFLLRPELEPVRSLSRIAGHHRMGSWYVVVTCLLPLLLGWPVAVLFRHGQFEATFAFALLVVLLTAAQAVLIARNSQSLADVERRRDVLDQARTHLEIENAKQYQSLISVQQLAAKEEAQYRLITDALPALVAYLDRELCYLRANKTYEVWFGVPVAEIEGKRLDDVIGSTAEYVRPHLLQALGGTAQHFEAQMHTLQGERTVSITHTPDADSEGLIRGVVVQATDITARKQAEAAVRQTEKLAAVGKLASSIAHEINNPLESVTNLLYIAKTSEDVTEIREYLSTAEEELRRVSVIANQTLRFHKQPTRPTVVQGAELFGSVLSIYRPRLSGRISLEERYRSATPVLCMEGEIRQVLNNLVGNAIDAMPEGGRLSIRCRDGRSFKTGEPSLLFTVADTGSGMSAQTLARISEAFFTTKGISGTGLGLWVSREIVERHAGALTVRSSQSPNHHGTVFRLSLPYRSRVS